MAGGEAGLGLCAHAWAHMGGPTSCCFVGFVLGQHGNQHGCRRAKDASSRRLIDTCCGAMGLSAQGVGDEEQGGKEEQGAFYPCRFPMEES